MESNQQNLPVEELLPRYCEGLTNASETKMVEEWMSEDKEHEQIVKQILSLNLALDTLQVMKKINTERALYKVKNRIKGKKSGWLVWTQRIAALLSIPLLLYVLLTLFHKQSVVTQMIEVRTNPGMTTSFILPDSTVVFLNSESTLQYPSVFEESREVKLSGEAYFEVKKDVKKRFIVHIPYQSRIEVLGTVFNVEAYDTDNQISATLVEGQIGFIYSKEGIAKKVAMKPNQRMIYTPASNEVKLYATNCTTETSWKDGMIILNNTPMEETLHLLEKRFNVEFIVKNKKFYEYSFTGRFTFQRIERIMEYFRISSQIHWRYVDGENIEEQKQQIELY